jgi:hypothetical protein
MFGLLGMSLNHGTRGCMVMTSNQANQKNTGILALPLNHQGISQWQETCGFVYGVQ